MIDINKLASFKTIGVGCSSFGGSTSRQTALSTLDYCYDKGIFYYDLARSYGYGTAEGIVGQFARGKREKIVITTKFGVLPARRVPFQTVLTKAVRQLRQQIPGGRNLIKKVATKTLSRTTFTPSMAGSSLEKSLGELRTDYLDFFLLHEADYTSATRDDLIAFMEQAKQQGKIRSWGYALSNRLDLEQLISKGGSGDLIQYQFGTDETYQNALKYEAALKVIYSIMSHRVSGDESLITQVLNHVRSYPGFARAENAQDLLLLYAYSQLKSGVLLLSMTNRSHIDKNISITQSHICSESEIALLSSMFTSSQKVRKSII